MPVIVTGVTLPFAAPPAPASVSDNVSPLHAAGIEPSEMVFTTSSTTVHEIVMPLSEPHELTLAVALTSFLDDELTFPATALPGTASMAAVTAANAGPKRKAYPVMATETPVTAEAAMLLELKSGEAAPAPSSVPVISPSEALLAPVNVTL